VKAWYDRVRGRCHASGTRCEQARENHDIGLALLVQVLHQPLDVPLLVVTLHRAAQHQLHELRHLCGIGLRDLLGVHVATVQVLEEHVAVVALQRTQQLLDVGRAQDRIRAAVVLERPVGEVGGRNLPQNAVQDDAVCELLERGHRVLQIKCVYPVQHRRLRDHPLVEDGTHTPSLSNESRP
jgi:hypothetical protein